MCFILTAMKDKKVIYFGDMLKMMNNAIINHDQVSFKAWRVGKKDDPQRGW